MRFFQRIASLFGLRRHKSGRTPFAACAGANASPEDEQRGGTTPRGSGDGGYAVQVPVDVGRARPGLVVVPCDSPDGRVQVPVSVDRARPGPVVVPCDSADGGVQVTVAFDRARPGLVFFPSDSLDGGVQGFKWFTRILRRDEDGDVADEFLEEIQPPPAPESNAQPTAKMTMRYNCC